MLSNPWSQIIDWIQTHDVLLGWAGLFSFITFVCTMVIIPIVILLLPPRYLLDPAQPAFNFNPLQKSVFLPLKNTIGGFLVVAGIGMLFLPGQGLLTLFVGVVLIDFPRKRKVVRWFLGRKRLLRLINRFRARFNRLPMESPVPKVPAAKC
jgi:hypothetical protein